jgi:hypothetical protein
MVSYRTVVLSPAGTSSGKPARSYATLLSERIALLTLGAAASDAMLWRAYVSTTKRTLKPARAQISENDQKTCTGLSMTLS